jgi:hypothetical protein
MQTAKPSQPDHSTPSTCDCTAAQAPEMFVERAGQLADSRPEGEDAIRWWHLAQHVGDLSALAIAS